MSIAYRGIEKYGPLQESDNGIWTTTIDHSFYFNASESPVDIMGDSNVPAKNSQHPSGNGLYALHRTVSEAQQGDGKKSAKYIVTIHYTNDLRLNTTIDASQSEVVPWKLPPYDISIYPIDVTTSFVKAYKDGDTKASPSDPVLNPAGDPFDAQTVLQNTIYRFSYNLRDFNDGWLDQFSDTINNSDVVVIDNTIPFQKGRIRNLGRTFQRIYKEDGTILYKYWKIDIEIEKSPKFWDVDLMNLGLWFLTTPSDLTTKTRIWTDNKISFGDELTMKASADVEGTTAVQVDTPQKLNVDGTLFSGTGATYTIFNNKFDTNWGPLSLPKTISGQTTTRKGLL